MQVPPELNDKSNPLINKGKIYISKTSPAAAIAAYQNQFQKDFFSFLMERSKEVVPGGRMVFTLNARRIADPTADESCLIWDYLVQALQDLVLKVPVVLPSLFFSIFFTIKLKCYIYQCTWLLFHILNVLSTFLFFLLKIFYFNLYITYRFYVLNLSESQIDYIFIWLSLLVSDFLKSH